MTKVKTIHSIPKRKPSNHFALQNMHDIFLSSNGQTDVVHKHDYYTVLIVEEAKGKHIIDDQVFHLKNKEVYFVSPGQPHQVDLDEQPQGWVLTFSIDFLLRNNIPQRFITNINLFNSFNHSPPLELDDHSFGQILKILNEIKFYLATPFNYKERALAAMLQLFLIHCNNSCSIDITKLEEGNRSFLLMRDFKEMVENNFTKWHKVSNYSNEMHISSKHLSSEIKKISGKTAKEMIQDRIILEAKRHILHSDLSIKQIGFEIGFDEPLHFSAFFKKCVGLSPTIYRKNILLKK